MDKSYVASLNRIESIDILFYAIIFSHALNSPKIHTIKRITILIFWINYLVKSNNNHFWTVSILIFDSAVAFVLQRWQDFLIKLVTDWIITRSKILWQRQLFRQKFLEAKLHHFPLSWNYIERLNCKSLLSFDLVHIKIKITMSILSQIQINSEHRN